ncbi:MAG: STT3 domain-containing protein [Candidatus Bathyarchaeota archaeon]|jgi:dolichyl-diphosphooligosaccharide--protein glycosyltransferase
MAKNTGQDMLGGLRERLATLRVGLNRRTILEFSVLGMVVVLAVLFRTMKVRWGAYMDAYDPLFQIRVTKYIVDNGYKAWFSWHDTLSWYPWGRDIPTSSFPGVPFSGAFVYFAAQALGIDITVDAVCLYFPVLMGALTCIVAYYLGRDLGGSSTGLLTAFFVAISEAFIGRTALGFYDTENIGIFGMTTTVFLFLRSLDQGRSQTQRIIYGAATGLSLGYIFASWGAARYVVGLLVLFILVTLLAGRFERRHLVSYSLTLGIGYVIAILVPKLGLKYIMSTENIAAILLVLLVAVYDVARQKLDERRTVLLMGGLILALIVGVLALEALGVSTPIRGKFLRVLNPFRHSSNPLSESVAEHKRAVWNNFFGSYGLTLPLAILGTYFAINNLDDRRLLCSLYFVTAIYFTGSMTRLSLILSIPVAIMAAHGLIELLTPFIPLAKGRQETGRRRSRTPSQGISWEIALVFILFIMVGIMPSIWGTAEASIRPTSLASSGIPAVMGGRYPQDWLQALSWMRDNLPEDAIVVSWWDYGYWIEALAGKTTLADGATSNRTQIGNIGRIMMLNYSESLPLLEIYDGTHIVVFNTFNPNDPTIQWPFGDNVKWQWMVQIPGLNISDYINERGQPAGKYEESTLNHLMTLSPDPGFELVFASDFRYVLVYEINYDAT